MFVFGHWLFLYLTSKILNVWKIENFEKILKCAKIFFNVIFPNIEHQDTHEILFLLYKLFLSYELLF